MAATRILLVKPYQPCPNFTAAPPLGLLYLCSQLRLSLGARVDVRVVDAKVARRPASELLDDLRWADVVGLSALNFEEEVCVELAAMAKALPHAPRVALGGPYAHGRAAEILRRYGNIDWVFDGESERSSAQAIDRWQRGLPFDGSIPGMACRQGRQLVLPAGNDFIAKLDEIPLPAWDQVDFDAYMRVPNMNAWCRGTRYATLFTSRGCPYKCAYCHDIFTKKFRWRSPENVLAEIDLLHDRYGVDEFQIVDDIFNLHKPRVRAIFAGLEARYGPGRFHFCFPNGLRGDILDRELIQTMRRGGAYQVQVAIETVTPRLQSLIDKNLDVAKVDDFIRYCDDEGIVVGGFFMLGFPTESLRELWQTIRFAWRSRLTIGSFFTVVPQPGTPLHELAALEGAAALATLRSESYYARRGWYERTYGVPLRWISTIAWLGFYTHPGRIWRILRRIGPVRAQMGLLSLLTIVSGRDLIGLAVRWRSWRARRRRGAPASVVPLPPGPPAPDIAA